MEFECTVNGQVTNLACEDHELLIDVIRERLALTGTKRSCDMEICGACTVLLDGVAVSSCTTLAAELEDRDLVTIEGLGDPENLSSVQQAFVDHGAAQCGFCTPGMVLTVQALVMDHPDADDETIKRYLSSTLCRCTGYVRILEAAKEAVNNT